MARLIDVRYVLIALSTAFAIAIAALLALQIDRAREEALEQGFRDARNLASTLAQHTRQSLLGVDLVLQGLTTPELSAILIDPQRRADTHTILRNRGQILPGVVSIIVVGPDGKLRASSTRAEPEAIDLSGRPEFAAIRDGQQRVLSAPFVAQNGASKGRRVLLLARRVEDRNGRFAGIVEASLGLDYFLEFYRRLDIGPRGVIGVTRSDSIVVIRYPLEESILGKSSVGSPVFEAYRRSSNGQGEVFSTYVIDQVDRLTAYRDVPDFDLIVTVGLALDDMLATWRRSAAAGSLAGLIAILLLASLTVLALRFVAAREAEQQAFTGRLNRLAAASADIARLHSREALADAMRRLVRDLIPGGQAEVSLGQPRQGTPDAGAIAAPLQAKDGRVLGALRVTRPEGPGLTRQDEAVLTQLALIGSVALENVELLADSQRLTAQAERARSEETQARRRIEDVFATMSEGVYTLDREWRFTFLNDKAVAMLLRPREQLVGRVLWDVFPQARGTDFERKLTSVRDGQGPAELELEYETPQGTRWMDIRAFQVDEGLSIYIRDISQRRETEGKLRQAQKMEAIGQLTGGIAHDFNNLLTVVLGNIDVLVESLAVNDKLRRVAEAARDAALRGATLVARLLAFARRQALAPRPVDVNALAGSVEDLLRRTIGETIAIAMTRAPDLWRANIDPVQMENALLNLALNARDAMPGGGTLTIETANAPLAGSEGQDAPAAGDYVMVAVRDTGTGMTADVRSRAFDPFFTTKPVGEGSGLGLSMVYGFVRQSGGYVRIDSEVGQGTTVRMYLPRAQDAPAAEAPQASVAPTPTGRETILLVEDDELVREHLSETLKGLGYAIIPCCTGREAIDMISGGARADLLLTDMVLGGEFNGHGVAQHIKELRPDLPVLYMSGFAEAALVNGATLDPGIHFIAKPFRRQEIARKLRDVLATHP
jgi:signal transduction histidine kinase